MVVSSYSMNTDMRNEKPEQLLDARGILRDVWETKARPSIQWLRKHTGKDIPVVRIGKLCFYSPSKVREALSLK